MNSARDYSIAITALDSTAAGLAQAQASVAVALNRMKRTEDDGKREGQRRDLEQGRRTEDDQKRRQTQHVRYLQEIRRNTVDAGRGFRDMADTVSRMITPLAGLTALGTGAGFFAAARDFADRGAEIRRTADTLGVTGRALQGMRGAAELAGVPASAATSGLGGLGTSMYMARAGLNGPMYTAAKEFGLNLGATSDEFMKQIADRMQNDPRLRTAEQKRHFASIFGLEEMIPLLRLGRAGIERLTEETLRHLYVSDKELENATRLYNAYTGLTQSVAGFATTISGVLAPSLTPVLKAMSEWLDTNKQNETAIGGVTIAAGLMATLLGGTALVAVTRLTRAMVLMNAAWLPAAAIGAALAAIGAWTPPIPHKGKTKEDEALLNAPGPNPGSLGDRWLKSKSIWDFLGIGAAPPPSGAQGPEWTAPISPPIVRGRKMSYDAGAPDELIGRGGRIPGLQTASWTGAAPMVDASASSRAVRGLADWLSGAMPPIIRISDDQMMLLLAGGASGATGGAGLRSGGGIRGSGAGGGGDLGSGFRAGGALSGGALEAAIRSSAAKFGVDPDIAMRVARSEGFGRYIGDRGTSFGAFQLHTGGGLGDRFALETGLDPRDPKNEGAMIDFSMRHLRETGWSPYHGARLVGVGDRQGIGVMPPARSPLLGAQPGVDLLSRLRARATGEGASAPEVEPADTSHHVLVSFMNAPKGMRADFGASRGPADLGVRVHHGMYELP